MLASKRGLDGASLLHTFPPMRKEKGANARSGGPAPLHTFHLMQQEMNANARFGVHTFPLM